MAARNALPVWMKILCVVMPGIAIFVGAGYMMAGKKDAGGEALWFIEGRVVGDRGGIEHHHVRIVARLQHPAVLQPQILGRERR